MGDDHSTGPVRGIVPQGAAHLIDDVRLIDVGWQPREASGYALEMEREYCKKYGTPKCDCWDNSWGHNVGMCFYAFYADVS